MSPAPPASPARGSCRRGSGTHRRNR